MIASSQKGCTLLEAMIVLAIVASLSVISLASFSTQITHNYLTDADRELIADLRLVRQKAVTEGISEPVRFDPEGRKYILPGLGERILPPKVRFGLKNGVPPLPDAVLPEDGVSFRDNILTFQANGTIVGVGGTIYLTNDPAHNETVAISVITTGRVKIRRWDGHVWQ